MADFKKAIAFVLSHEDPGLTGKVTHDSGGTTRYGISQKAFPAVDVAALTLDQAEEIYREHYWTKVRGDEIDDEDVAAKLLDMAVNMGARQAVVLCQRAINAISEGPLTNRLTEDGAMGPATLVAINQCRPQVLLHTLRGLCAAFYLHVATVKTSEARYLDGWLARARA